MKGIQHYSTAWVPPKLVAFNKRHGRCFEAFCGFEEEAMQLLPPLPEGYIYTDKSTAILKCRNVEPHKDSEVGSKPPKGYRFCGGAFGLLASSGNIVLQVGNDCERLRPGDWVMFDDSILHGVYAERVWYGLALQIAKKVNERKPT